MNSSELNAKIVNSLCKEFQSLWIIDIDNEDYAMQLFYDNEEAAMAPIVTAVASLNSYKKAQKLYLEKCVVEQDRIRVDKQTSVENILDKISNGMPYFVEYNRVNGSTINYNQLYFDGLTSDDGKMEQFVLGFRDIEVRKRAERDDLTGLYTRQIFFQKAEELIKRKEDVQYDLMLSDIVDFKEINETYGADVGDEVLRWSGAYLATKIEDDTIIGRYGGDQFAVLMSHDKMVQVNGKESRKAFLEKEKSNGLPATNVKYGIYEDVRKEKSIIAACDKAHMALNSIKHSYGQAVAYYGDAIKKEHEMHRKIENSMHKALEEEQFKVYYQPKHDAATGKLIGAEALIRWIHPEYGFMSPGEFIPIFEHNGFIVESDYYVWRRTCSNIRRWKDKGIRVVPISVNASKLTFKQEDLLRKLQDAVDESGISPKQLHVEITETMMEEDVDSLVRKLTAIRAVGYEIELDDFGSGYSSLNILSTLPMDIVKLDMSFMKQFGDEKRAKVLAACIKLARELGYKTVSEGVELKEQCDMLNILGVDAIQGYYYSKPLPEEEFEKYMMENL